MLIHVANDAHIGDIAGEFEIGGADSEGGETEKRKGKQERFHVGKITT
jgi:hypothetical protein